MMNTGAIAIVCVSVILGIIATGFIVGVVIEIVYRCQRQNAEEQIKNYERQVTFNAKQQKQIAGRMTEYGNSLRNPLTVRNSIVRPRPDEDMFSIEDDTPHIGGVNKNGEPV